MNGLSGTALHTASTRQIAETLVNAVSVENRSKFILTASLSGNTALHETSEPDVAEYLLSLDTRVQVKTVPYHYICANSGFSDANEFVSVNKLLLSIINKVYGETPLLDAIHASNAPKTEVILQWMVQKGLDIHSFLHYRYRPKKNAFDIARQLHGDEPKELMTIITKFHKPAGLTSADLTSNDKYETVDATEIPLSHTILEDSYLRDEVATLLKSDRSWHQLTRGEVFSMQSFIVSAKHSLWQNKDFHLIILGQKRPLLQRYGENLAACSVDDPAFIGSPEKLLHKVKDKETAQLLVVHVKKENGQDFTFHISSENWSALHTASMTNRFEVAEYLSKVVDDSDKFLLLDPGLCGTALHVAASGKIAELLVNGVSKGQRGQFLKTMNKRVETALHTAKVPDVAEYILSLLTKNFQMIILGQKRSLLQRYGDNLAACSFDRGFIGSPEKLLHKVKDKETAQLVVEHVKKENRQDFIFHVSSDNWSALHTASMTNRFEVAEYLLTVVDDSDKFLLLNPGLCGTALHVAASGKIAKLLVNAVSEGQRGQFLKTVNKRGETALHTAKAPDVAEYILSHNAKIKDAALPPEVAAGSSIQVNRFILTMEDEKGNTPLLNALNRGAVEVVKSILRTVEDKELGIGHVLRHQNTSKQNAFHLACRNEVYYSVKACKSCEKYLCHPQLTPILCEYLCYIEPSEMLSRDMFGNTILYYASIANCKKLFACLLMHNPMASRAVLIRQYGTQDIMCKQPSGTHRLTLKGLSEDEGKHNMFYLLTGTSSKSDYIGTVYDNTLNPDYWNAGDDTVTIICDPQIHKIMCYGANVYSLTDSASTALISSSEMQCHGHESFALGCLIIDDADLADDRSRRSILGRLMKLDNEPSKKGKPKIIIRRKTANDVIIAPPGADFVLLTIREYHTDTKEATKPSWMTTQLPVHDLDTLVNKLRIEHNVRNVNINSTCVMHIATSRQSSLLDPYSLSSAEHVLITGPDRGKALLICVRKGRDEWEEQYNNAKYILRDQMGLKVKVVFDLTAAEMISEVSEFANSPDHGQMAALVVMSHGDGRGNLSGAEDSEENLAGVREEATQSDQDDKICSVQALVDALCVEKLSNIPKVLWLSFCRGGIVPKHNRSLQGPYAKTIARLIESTEFDPGKIELSPKERRKVTEVYKTHPFPEVEVPPDCYINYVTLPDSKSPRDNIVFREMKQYIRDLVHEAAKMETPNIDRRQLWIQKQKSKAATNAFNNPESSNRDRIPDDIVQGAGLDNSFTQTSNDAYCAKSDDKHIKTNKTGRAIVSLVDLFTDVAGMVREKSGGRITTNHSYTLNRHSKTVVIDIVRPPSARLMIATAGDGKSVSGSII